MTFAELCTYYENHYVKEVEYVGDQKVSGLRSWYTVKKQLQMLKDYFGCKALRSITYGNIRQFRSERFRTKTKEGRSAPLPPESLTTRRHQEYASNTQ